MSLSESEKELLLSASIDGALSDDERETLDRWLKVDPAAVKRLEEMETLRRELRESLGQLRSAGSQRLGSAFADAVVSAAIAQAKADQLPDDHPLRRIDHAGHRKAAAVSSSKNVSPVSGSPVAGSSSNGSGLMWPRIATVAALAASLLVAAVLYRNADNRQVADRGEDNSVATDWSTDGAVAKEEASATMSAAARGVAGLDSDGFDTEAFSESSVASQSPEPMLAEPMLAEKISADPLASGDAADSDSLAANGASAMRRSTGDDPASAMRSDSPDADVLAAPSAGDAMMLSVVMVVSVELTPAGRQSLALLQALRESDIRMGADGLLSDQVLDGLRTDGAVAFGGTADVAGESSRLYYVEAPAKQIDQFLMRLMGDTESFASIGLSITDEPAVMTSIGGWATIDSDDSSAVARDLVAADGNRVALEQGDSIIPLPRDDASGPETLGMLTPPDAGDAKSQILLLVK